MLLVVVLRTRVRLRSAPLLQVLLRRYVCRVRVDQLASEALAASRGVRDVLGYLRPLGGGMVGVWELGLVLEDPELVEAEAGGAGGLCGARVRGALQVLGRCVYFI